MIQSKTCSEKLYLLLYLQWEPENSEIGRRLLDLSYDNGGQCSLKSELCSVNRPFHLISDLFTYK